MGNWKTIETAPKDGKSFLVYGPECDIFFEGFGVVWYCYEAGDFIEGDLGVIEDGYYTHWQPLPEPPHD